MMNTDHDELDDEYVEDEAPRSIFSAVWFRVVLVVLALGVVGALAIPYVLDMTSAPPTTTARAASPPTPEGAGPRAVTTLAEPAKPVAPTPVAPPKPPTPATPMTPASPSATATPAEPAKRTEPERAKTAEPAKPTPSASVESAKPVERPKTSEPAKRSERAKVAESARTADDANAFPAAKRAIPRGDRVAAARPSASDGGEYFVQVGAFKDEATAKRVASRLRDGSYPVAESTKRASDAPAEPPKTATRPAATATDRYDVLVSGRAAADINAKLAAKGLASEPTGDGVRIRPSLPLRDAVALSKDLGNDGFKVQVRRGGASGEAVSPAPSAAAQGSTIYRVRVGGYADRDAAQVVMRELRDKGYDAFIAKGRD